MHCPCCAEFYDVLTKRQLPCPGITCAACQEKDAEIARLITDLRYVQGIVERGEKRTLGGDEPITQAILQYVKKLESLVSVGRVIADWIMGHPTTWNTHAAIKLFKRWRSLEGEG